MSKKKPKDQPVLQETALSQRLLLALSQATQSVQRARTEEEIYRAVGDEMVKLGFHAVVFGLTDNGASLVIRHLTFESRLLRAAEKLAGVSAKDSQIPCNPGSFYYRVLQGGESLFLDSILVPLSDSMPSVTRPLAGQILALMDLRQGIYVPLIVSGKADGLLLVTGADLTEEDVPAATIFANQISIALENARLYQESRNWAAELERRVEEQTATLSESERKFHDTVKYLDEGYYKVTTDGLLLEHNQAYNRILGFDIAEDLRGQRTPST